MAQFRGWLLFEASQLTCNLCMFVLPANFISTWFLDQIDWGSGLGLGKYNLPKRLLFCVIVELFIHVVIFYLLELHLEILLEILRFLFNNFSFHLRVLNSPLTCALCDAFSTPLFLLELHSSSRISSCHSAASRLYLWLDMTFSSKLPLRSILLPYKFHLLAHVAIGP
jgi:hypothetical protein